MFTPSKEQQMDLVIVGGGVTGAALAYLATQARPSLRVCLFEAAELASGTSSRSSRFLHGGFRYLAQGRIGLVRRLLEGRAELAALAPELVRPAPFLLPVGGAHQPHPTWLLRAALGVYGALERRGPSTAGLTAAHHLDAYRARRVEPLLDGVPLEGALAYGELTVDDAGLVRALAHGAVTSGAVLRTHTRCTGLLRAGGRVVGVTAKSAADGAGISISAHVVVDATGPWCGGFYLPGVAAGRARRTIPLVRGTHVGIPRSALPLSRTLVFFAPQDGRALFASPRGDSVVLGTTEVAHSGSVGDVVPSEGEVRYLLEALAATLPAARPLARETPMTAFAGVRSLAAGGSRATGGAEGRSGTSALDRDYDVRWEEPALLAIRGGKLTLAMHGARRALAAVSRERTSIGLPKLVIPSAGELPALVGTPPADDGAANDVPSSRSVLPRSWRAA